ncbi:MAG: hypothetical protein K2L51_02155 [Clostridiales bacterium]|nr:hypothetical protein [Clostridiales bacterium]
MAKKYVYPCLGGVAVLLLALCVFMPSASVAGVAAAGVLLYGISLAAGAWVLPAAAAVYAAASVCFSGADMLGITGAVLLCALSLPRMLRKKLPLWWEIALCAAVGVIAVCGTLGVFALATGKSVRGAIVAYYEKLSFDPLASALAKRYYAECTAEQLGHAPFVPADELYVADTLAAYASHIGSELEGNTLWYVTGFGAFAGGVSCAGAAAIAKTDGVLPVEPRLRDMRLGKTYLLAAVVPALAFALLGFYEPMQPVTRTVVNLMVTLPTCFCGITLLFHSLCRIPGRAGRIAAQIVFWAAVAALALFFEWGLLVFGFLGLADCVLHVRKLLDWALS